MEIVLLTQASCRFCDQAKETLDRLADEYDFSMTTLDLASPDGRGLADRGGVMFPPGVFIDGQPFSYGRLSERKLRRELDRRIGSRRSR
jgi:glutaredoxin